EAESRSSPDNVIFQSWVSHPSHLLPDTDPGSFTYLIGRYFRPRTRLEVQPIQNAVGGRLVDNAGEPVAQARVDISGLPYSGRGFATEVSLHGIVPPGAKTGVLGLRINTECDCWGSADVSIGTLHYWESGAGSGSVFFAPGAGVWREAPATQHA